MPKVSSIQSSGVLQRLIIIGTIEGNDIFDNAMAGIWVKLNSTPIVRNNKIHSGRDAGICIFSGSKGIFEKYVRKILTSLLQPDLIFSNEIFGNAQTGVIITHENTRPVIRENRIFDGNANGIEISKNASPIIHDNQVFNNRLVLKFYTFKNVTFSFGGIEICSGSSECDIDNNKIFSNRNLIKNALTNGECLYKVTSYKHYPFQSHYRCITCNSSGSSWFNCYLLARKIKS